MSSLQYTEDKDETDVFLAIVDDGFEILIGPSRIDEFSEALREVTVWPSKYPDAALTRICDDELDIAKSCADQMLREYRAVAEHFREQGRSEVRAVQGELAKVITSRSFLKCSRCARLYETQAGDGDTTCPFCSAPPEMAAAMISIPRDNKSGEFADHERDLKAEMAAAVNDHDPRIKANREAGWK